MPDERRLERLLKKAKPFLDEKQKAKSRLKSLVTFLEGTTEPDHIRAHLLIYEQGYYRPSRNTERAWKYINCVDSKALLEWTAPSIIGVFELFLATGCHQRFRVEGLRLLLQYISASGTYQSDEYTQLYSDAIQLDLFEPACPSLSDWQQNNPSEEEIPSFSQSSLSSRWIGKGRGSLLQNPIRVIKRGSTEGDATQAVFPLSIPKDTILYPVPWATQTDQCELIDEILQNLMNLATALAFSIPQLEYSPTSLSDSLAGIIGQRMSSMWLIFRKTYLRLLFPSVSRYVGIEIQDNQGFEHCPPQILQKLVRFIVRTVSPNISVSTVMSPPEFAAAAITDVILAENGSIDTVQEIIKQALRLPTSFYKTTQSALFVIVSWLSSSPEQNSPGLESNSALQKEEEEIDMCDTITLRERQINRKLRKYIKNIQLVFTPKPVFPEQHEISRAVPSEKENSRFRSGRKTIGKGKNLKDLAAAIGDGAKISSHISDQPSTPLTNQSTGVWEFSTLKDSRFLEKLSIPPPSPNIDKGRKEGCASQDSRDSTLLVSKETRPYILSILCTIGRVSEIKTPEIHYEAILCISQVWDLLEKIRESQKFDNVHMPSLFDFAATLFDVTYLPIEFVNSIVVAVGCISRIMCRRHDQVFSEEYYIHYYRILDKWLSGTSSAVISSILLNTQRIFTLSLPGSCILIPRFLKSIHFMTSQKDIPDAVSTASIQILSSLVCMKSSTVSPADELPTISPRKMYPADTPSMAKPRIYEESSSNPITDLVF
ncbi:hypothetical protein BASA60_004772 [Batrachochytrium salamandrivorans]|nr:hypothetical protein BASA60_004772 [Batrachochytrium salamandrivorans]